MTHHARSALLMALVALASSAACRNPSEGPGKVISLDEEASAVEKPCVTVGCAESQPSSTLEGAYAFGLARGARGALVSGGHALGEGERHTTREAAMVEGSSWRRVQPMHRARAGHTLTWLDNACIAIGGSAEDPERSPFEIPPPERFDAERGSWRELVPSPPASRAYHSALALDRHRLVLAGGAASWERHLASVALFDSRSGEWTALGRLSEGRSHLQSVSDERRVWWIGGRRGPDCEGECAYDCIEDEDCRDGLVCADEWFCARPSDAVDTMDLGTLTVAAGPQLLHPRFGHGAVRVKEDLLVAGGRDLSGAMDRVEVLKAGSTRFEDAAPLTEPRADLALTSLPDGRALATGGRVWKRVGAPCVAGQPCEAEVVSVALRSSALFDPASGTWSRGPELKEGRYLHDAFVDTEGRVVLVGGRDAKGHTLGSEVLEIAPR